MRDPNTNQPFPNNQIPASRFDPLAMDLLKRFVPAAQDSLGTYRYQRSADNNPTRVLARGDHNQGLNQFTWRSYLSRGTTPLAYGALPSFANGRSMTNTAIHTFSHTRIFTARTINIMRFSYNSWDEGRASEYDKYPIEELRALGWSKN